MEFSNSFVNLSFLNSNPLVLRICLRDHLKVYYCMFPTGSRVALLKLNFCYSGYVSSRHTRQGTWFIRAIVEALYKHACHRDLQSLFKQVRLWHICTHHLLNVLSRFFNLLYFEDASDSNPSTSEGRLI